MKNAINLVIIGAVLVSLGLGCGGGSNNGSPSKTTSITNTTSTPNAAAPAAEKPIAIQSKALTKAYDENELAADGKYKGKVLAVTGKITNIAETLGNVTASLEGHSFVISVMCTFDESEKDSVAKLKKGQQATFAGIGDGSTAGLYVGLTKCKIQ
ncbi:MAG: hypothetical protein WBD27_08960 [Pyrinomonadaceae bacterium]